MSAGFAARSRVSSPFSMSRVCFAGASGSGARSAPLAKSAMWAPPRRPNTTRSPSELVPSRLAPCTDTQAHSPAAYRPVTWVLAFRRLPGRRYQSASPPPIA